VNALTNKGLPASADETTDLSNLLQYSNDRAFICEMIDSFLKDIPVELQKMERALFPNDIDAVKFISHHLKTSVGYMGFRNETWNLLDEMENCSLEEFNSEKTISNFSKLRSICQKAQIELKRKEDEYLIKI